MNITEEHHKQYEEKGFFILRGYFDADAIGRVKEVAMADKVMADSAMEVKDSEGKRSKLTLWYQPLDNIYKRITHNEGIINAVEKIVGGKAHHYHTKVMQKEPKVGGAWEWHQDYGYWYKNGFLQPKMLSVMTALTEANKENGCLQVIPGSHKMNRIEHGFSGEQVGADAPRTDACAERNGIEYVELQPGDVLFFHCNLLHRSNANNSNTARWSLITAYNAADNFSFMGEESENNRSVAIDQTFDLGEFDKAAPVGVSSEAGFNSKEKDLSLNDK